VLAAALILLNNDFASIPVAIEMGRLVFDNLKKVTLYLMPVSQCIIRIRLLLTVVEGWKLHRIHGSALERYLRNANPFELVSTSLFLYHQRRGHVDFLDVRES
jgi:hypothetical protein